MRTKKVAEYCINNSVPGLGADFGGLEGIMPPMLDIKLGQVVTMTPIFAAKANLAYLEWEYKEKVESAN